MKIIEIINAIKGYCKGENNGEPCHDDRDKVLFGDANQECTGIVSTVFASVDVIKEAIAHHANFIIVNESLFWNHGDQMDWLAENKTFQAKVKLLKEHKITVWRLHEYIRSGIPYQDTYMDPINYGFCWKMGWTDRIIEGPEEADIYAKWMVLQFQGETVKELGMEINQKLGLQGMQIIGDENTQVHTLYVPPGSIMGYTAFDNAIISHIEKYKYDCVMGLELVDYTVAEYIRDSAMAGIPRAILHVGHFNAEEPGMEYAVEWIPNAIKTKDIPIYYVNSKDPFVYI